MYYTKSYHLYKRKKYFFENGILFLPSFLAYIPDLLNFNMIAVGWGYRSGEFAKNRKKYLLLEDGFIRSVGLGVEHYPAFSVIEDDKGMFYDATKESRLEYILQNYDFNSDKELMDTAIKAIELIKEYKISKYNLAPFILPEKVKNSKSSKKVLIIAQTYGDFSLSYGLANRFTQKEMIEAAISENPDSDIFVKVHPDVLYGKKESSIDIDLAKQYCTIIDENVNPIILMQEFDKVYTQTSQMGFEALLLGKEVICFGSPFYSGWGVTDDRIDNDRRKRKLSVEEIFAGAYILYSKYYNPYKKRKSDIIDTIETIKEMRDKILK